jgi:hypothetical protein
MATVASTRVTGPAQMPGIGDGQSLKSISVKYDYTSAITNGDTITGPLIQAGSVVVDVLVVVAGTGLGSATLNVGDATDIDRFITGGTGVVQRTNAATGFPWLVPTNTTINITTGTANTGASGTIYLTVFFQPRNT